MKNLIRKIRILMFYLKYAKEAERTKDAKEKAAYQHLADLAVEATACLREGPKYVEIFMQKLDQLIEDGNRNELDNILNGIHNDVPEWLRK